MSSAHHGAVRRPKGPIFRPSEVLGQLWSQQLALSMWHGRACAYYLSNPSASGARRRRGLRTPANANLALRARLLAREAVIKLSCGPDPGANDRTGVLGCFREHRKMMSTG